MTYSRTWGGPLVASALIAGTLDIIITGVLVHMFLIGAPIAWGARRAFR